MNNNRGSRRGGKVGARKRLRMTAPRRVNPAKKRTPLQEVVTPTPEVNLLLSPSAAPSPVHHPAVSASDGSDFVGPTPSLPASAAEVSVTQSVPRPTRPVRAAKLHAIVSIADFFTFSE